jgi:hypothetical protein
LAITRASSSIAGSTSQVTFRFAPRASSRPSSPVGAIDSASESLAKVLPVSRVGRCRNGMAIAAFTLRGSLAGSTTGISVRLRPPVVRFSRVTSPRNRTPTV